MSRYRKFTTAVAVAALAFGLAACGGGGSPTTMDPPGPTKDEQIAALQKEINDLRAQLGLAADDNLGASVADLQSQVANLKQQIQDAKDTAEAAAAEKMRMEMAAAGKALHAALGAAPLSNLGTDGTTLRANLSRTGLIVGVSDGAASPTITPSPNMMAGDSAGSLGSWMGLHYAHMDSGTKVSNAAVAYTNRGAAKTQPFAEKYADDTNYTGTTRTLALGTSADSKIKSGSFPTAGVKTYTGSQNFRGTYDGAMGSYKCTTGCTATYGQTGIALGGTWTFVHDSGATTSTADSDYLYFGWWLTKDKNGKPTSASAFTGIVGAVTAPNFNLDSISGTVNYAGKAAGKFAMSNPLDGTGDAGHFTADAMLNAKFGTGTGAGISGTIDNFMANDKAVPWSVKLNRAGWGATGAITAPADDATTPANEALGTVWSIDGNSAPASGTWSGQTYDEATTDGSNVPTTVTGTFASEFGSIGRLVGAFGATKQ